MSSRAGNTSRLTIDVNKGVTGALFGLAMITFIIRSYVRIQVTRKLYAEDFILVLTGVSLCASTGLYYASLTANYEMLQMVLHGFGGDLAFKVLDEVPKTSKEANANATIGLVVIFSVKLAFLVFFRRMIYRLWTLKIWWWFATILTVIAGLVSVVVAWLTCPYFTVDGLLTCAGPSAEHRTTRDIAVTTAMDIMSDLLVLSLPIIVLWKVRISLRQKIGLASSLCLSCIMVVVTIVRMAGLRQGGSGSVDIIWPLFWQQQECNIAVIVVSVSAFRPLFMPSPASSPIQRQRKYWLSEKGRRFRRRRHDPDLYDTQQTNGLPQVASATLTGGATVNGDDGISVDTADPDQRFHGHLPPSEHDRSTTTSTTNSSSRDAELGLPTDSILPNTRHETSNAMQSKSSNTPWWKALLQPETGHTTTTTRTGYWDVISFFRSEHSESVVESKGQL